MENKDIFSGLSGHEFESLIEQLVRKMGFIIEERKLTADGGVDILAVSSTPIFEGKYVIQCKRYSSSVGEPILRDLYGVVHSLNANKGILITTSNFTKSAINFAKNKQIELIDGGKLQVLLVKYGLIRQEVKPVLPEAIYIMHLSFVEPLKHLKEVYEDIKLGRVYIERREITNLTKWIDSTQVQNQIWIELEKIQGNF